MLEIDKIEEQFNFAMKHVVDNRHEEKTPVQDYTLILCLFFYVLGFVVAKFIGLK